MDTDLLLLERFIKGHPMQAAQTIEVLEDEEIAAFLEEIPVELAVSLTSLMNIYKASKCLKLIKTSLAVELLEKNDVQKAELLLRQLDEGFREELLGRLSDKLAAVLRQKLEYPAYSIGALMAPLGFLLRMDMIVKDAVKALKKEKKRIPATICVVDEGGALAGLIGSHELLLGSDTDQNISTIMKTEIPAFFADQPVESVKDHPAWNEYRTIPVVDSSEKLIGNLPFEATRKNTAGTDQELTKHVLETSNALGELYRIGLTAFLQSVSKGD